MEGVRSGNDVDSPSNSRGKVGETSMAKAKDQTDSCSPRNKLANGHPAGQCGELSAPDLRTLLRTWLRVMVWGPENRDMQKWPA